MATSAALCLVGRVHSVPGIVAGWCLVQVGVNAMQAGLAAGVPDRVPIAQRATVSGWIGIAQTVSVVVAAALVTKVSGYPGYLLLAAGVVALALPFVARTADPPLPRTGRPDFNGMAFVRSCWQPGAWNHDFRWAWLTRFLLVLGNAMAVVYLLYFLRRIGFSVRYPGHPAEQGLVVLLSVYTVAVVATTVAAARRLTALAADGDPWRWPGASWQWPRCWSQFVRPGRPSSPRPLSYGAGFGIYLSIDQALVTQVLPSAAQRARGLGVISVASSAGQAVAPAIAAPVVTYLGGFTTLYLLVAAVAVLGSASVLRIRSVP